MSTSPPTNSIQRRRGNRGKGSNEKVDDGDDSLLMEDHNRSDYVLDSPETSVTSLTLMDEIVLLGLKDQAVILAQ